VNPRVEISIHITTIPIKIHIMMGIYSHELQNCRSIPIIYIYIPSYPHDFYAQHYFYPQYIPFFDTCNANPPSGTCSSKGSPIAAWYSVQGSGPTRRAMVNLRATTSKFRKTGSSASSAAVFYLFFIEIDGFAGCSFLPSNFFILF